MIPAEERRATLLTLYPLFKEEVYRRRHEMMRWTAIGVGSLVAMLFLVLLTPTTRDLSIGGRMLLSSGVGLFTLTIAVLLLQQRARHREAKRTLIELEQGLSLFGSDSQSGAGPIYPERWKTDWQKDWSTSLALTLLALLTLVTISAILVVQ